MKKPSPARHAGAPRQVRIIGGDWKRTPLPVPELEGLRPTPDRVRETLFNWIEHLQHRNWTGRRCLDLFAGTGALGFEAASRGAAEVTMVESHPAAIRQLQASCDKLQATSIKVLRGDAMRQLPALSGPYDLIFLDPPYGLQLLPELLPRCARLLRPGGLVYAESDQPFAEPRADWLQGWQVVRADKAGQVYFGLLMPDDNGVI